MGKDMFGSRQICHSIICSTNLILSFYNKWKIKGNIFLYEKIYFQIIPFKFTFLNKSHFFHVVFVDLSFMCLYTVIYANIFETQAVQYIYICSRYKFYNSNSYSVITNQLYNLIIVPIIDGHMVVMLLSNIFSCYFKITVCLSEQASKSNNYTLCFTSSIIIISIIFIQLLHILHLSFTNRENNTHYNYMI